METGVVEIARKIICILKRQYGRFTEFPNTTPFEKQCGNSKTCDRQSVIAD